MTTLMTVGVQIFQIVLSEEPEGGYSVEVPELPGCFTEGDTLAEALAKAREAIVGYLSAKETS